MEFGSGIWDLAESDMKRTKGGRSVLDWAIDHEEWELAALCLLYGMLRALDKLPPETVEAMLEELDGMEEVGSQRHRERRVSRRSVRRRR
jgi:hypothetical protein